MKSNQSIRIIILVIVSFAAYYFLFSNFKTIKTGFDIVTKQGLLSYILTYLAIGIPIFIGTYFIHQASSILKNLGITSNILSAMWISMLFTLPMFVGGLLFFRFNPNIDFENLFAATMVAGFMEELYFRGFLFGQIFRKTNLGFILSILFGALIFAFGHLYQSQVISEIVGIFLVTFSGAVFFAWLYVEWNYNLWVPVFTHTLMNLSWGLFEIDNSALGDVKANIFRGLTISLAILFTITVKRRKNEKMLINKHTLFPHKDNGGLRRS